MVINTHRPGTYGGFLLASALLFSMVFVFTHKELFWDNPVYFWWPGALFAAVFGIFVVARFVRNRLVRDVEHGAALLGRIINNAVVKIMLVLVYIVGVGVVAVTARVVGKKFIDARVDWSSQSWWEPLHLSIQKRERYYDMF